MITLVINSGSSSIKHRLYDLPQETELHSGAVTGIGAAGGAPDHATGIATICEQLPARPQLIAHRVVHGGEEFSQAVVLTEQALQRLDGLSHLAPLHNPANLLGVRMAQQAFADATHVAVFDTAFHRSIPDYAAAYALPAEVAERHAIRRYGFHGSSHRWASRRVAEALDRPVEQLRTVVLHLGAGCSACAVCGGDSIDTTMGFTPIAGLMMATRTGDIDPGVLTFLMRDAGWSVEDLDRVLNRESGLKGMAGDGDLRAVLAAAEAGDQRSRVAVDAYVYRIAKQVGAYAVALGGLDALVFTGGVGENSSPIRAAVCERLRLLGVAIDADKNEQGGAGDWEASAAGSTVRVVVIAANEELQIAREAYAVRH